MSVPQEEGLIRAWAYALALIVLCLPISSPDLFWHLSAGRWIVAHLAIPHSDPFTFTVFGTPWVDFEWGQQLIWYIIHSVAGLRGLWVFKGVLIAGCFVPIEQYLKQAGASGVARAGALALWLAAMLAQADLRADHASALFFAILLARLARGYGSFLFGFGLFAVWSNLHAGFALAFVLYVAAAAVEFVRNRSVSKAVAAEIVGAVLGSALNPYGLEVYRVFGGHASASMVRFVAEWAPPSLHNSSQIPLFAALAIVLGMIVSSPRTVLSFRGLCALGLGAAAILSARFASYFAPAAVIFVFSARPQPRTVAVACGLLALTGLLYQPISRAPLAAAFEDIYVARRASDFIAREGDVFRDLRLFNQYEWGGYLGWRLGPERKIYGDGRYLFHDQLSVTQAALDSPQALADFADREKLDAFLIRRYPQTYVSTRLYPNGEKRSFVRPWHILFFPRERWALVWFDEQSLVYVNRQKAPAAWLAAHEYRWRRPGDKAALNDAMSRREIPLSALAAEDLRHSTEVP